MEVIVDLKGNVYKEQIVRCKECRRFHQHSEEDIKLCGFTYDGYCRYWNCHSTNADDFCSYGERESDDT